MSGNKPPWEHHPDIWKNEVAFFTYLRGRLRLLWSRYPAKLKWKSTQLVKPPRDYTGRAKNLGQCHYCKEMFAASHLEVDHVEQAGKCNSWETASEFLYKLLDCNGNWVLACKPCHKIKSYSESQNISFEDAAAAKKVIEIMKKSSKEVRAFLQQHGYNGDMVSNASKRKALVEKIMKGSEGVNLKLVIEL